MSGDVLRTLEGDGPLADQAVHWLVLLRSEQATPDDHLAFLTWLRADPRHQAAWGHLTAALRQSFGRLDQLIPTTPTRPHSIASAQATFARASSRRRFLQFGLTTAVVGAAGVAGAASRYPLRTPMADLAAATGERRQYPLDETTTLMLDARSLVDMERHASGTVLSLLEGAVAVHASLPTRQTLTIRTQEGVIDVTGTRVMVRQETRRTLLVVQHGEATVRPVHARAFTLAAGAGIRFGQNKIDSARTDLMDEAAWQSGLIQVRAKPLLGVINALRPYHPGLLHVSVAAGALIVTGRFTLDNVDLSLDALASQVPITVRRMTPWITLVDVANT